MNNQDEFIDNLKRDKARGSLAPHQIILLISIKSLISTYSKSKFSIDELSKEFDASWDKYSKLFATKNKSIGMPLKAMLNKNLIEVKTNDAIINYRNRNEILSKIISIQLSEQLLVFLNSIGIEYLEQRITI